MAGDFLEKLDLYRACNTSNVFVLCTSDAKRIPQVIEHLRRAYSKVLLYDLQLQRLYEVVTAEQGWEKREVKLDLMANVYAELFNRLGSTNVALVVKHAYAEERALSDFLVACAQAPELYARQSSVVVFASDAGIFPEFLGKLAVFIEVSASEEERRVLIHTVKRHVEKKRQMRIRVDRRVYAESRGLNLHETETATLLAIRRSGYRKVSAEAFRDFKVELLKKHGLSYVLPERGFESVGGYSALKDYIRRRVVAVLKNPEKAQRYGIAIPRGLLFYGPPGTGKTYIAKALARELALPMIQLNMGDFLRGIVGESERRVRKITRLIESLAPCVVFMDEFDQLALARDSYFSGDSGVTRRVQNQLLEWLGDEQRKSLIVGATNFVEQLDEAFIRVGRIDEIIPVLYPAEEARREILKVHLSVVRRVPHALTEFELAEIARATEWFTGAELERLVKEASFLAFEAGEKVTAEHFDRALEDFQINAEQRRERLKQALRALRGMETMNRRFLRELEKELVFVHI